MNDWPSQQQNVSRTDDRSVIILTSDKQRQILVVAVHNRWLARKGHDVAASHTHETGKAHQRAADKPTRAWVGARLPRREIVEMMRPFIALGPRVSDQLATHVHRVMVRTLSKLLTRSRSSSVMR
jgi:hypothetical protein